MVKSRDSSATLFNNLISRLNNNVTRRRFLQKTLHTGTALAVAIGCGPARGTGIYLSHGADAGEVPDPDLGRGPDNVAC